MALKYPELFQPFHIGKLEIKKQDRYERHAQHRLDGRL